MPKYPTRIVLTEETTETLYLLGQGDRIVGVSGYTVRPPEARQKPKVSAFINARFDKIEALRPDLVLAFSDLQADLVAELVRRGLTVVTFNQRTVAEIPADDSNARRSGRMSGRSRAHGERLRGRPRLRPPIRRQVSATAAYLVRRVGRPTHLGHPVGRGARGDRGRRRHSSPSSRAPRSAGTASSIRRKWPSAIRK